MHLAAVHDPEALAQRERDLIDILGIERGPWQFQRGLRGGTQFNASFRYALTMPDAPVALAMLRAYISAVGLDQSDDWSISAMPSWTGATGKQRFATVSGGHIEPDRRERGQHATAVCHSPPRLRPRTADLGAAARALHARSRVESRTTASPSLTPRRYFQTVNAQRPSHKSTK